jgi:hypothetical protein
VSQSIEQMPRALRVARGASGAVVATLLAAASHALAGGPITALAIIATALMAWPLCTALAGRIASLWRLSLAIVAAQFLYHWSFSGLGIASAAEAGADPAPAHAAHLSALPSFAPAISGASADTMMWLMHAVAAILTITLVHRGERAFLALLGLLRRIITLPSVSLAHIRHTAFAIIERASGIRIGARLFSAVSHRGPPLCP